MKKRKFLKLKYFICLSVFYLCFISVEAETQESIDEKALEIPHYISWHNSAEDSEKSVTPDTEEVVEEEKYVSVTYNEYYAPFLTYADSLGVPIYQLNDGEWVDFNGKQSFSYKGVIMTDVILHGEGNEYYYIHPDGNLLDCFQVDDGMTYIGRFDEEGRILNEAPGITDLRNLADCDNVNKGEVFVAMINSITREYCDKNDIPYESFLDYSEGGITGYDYEDADIHYSYEFIGPGSFKITVGGDRYDCGFTASLYYIYDTEELEYLFYVMSSVVSKETLTNVIDVIEDDGWNGSREYQILGYDDNIITVRVEEVSQNSYKMKFSCHIDHLYYHGIPSDKITASDF